MGVSGLQEKQKFSERQIEELSGRVSALELEKQELQRALDQARHGHQVCLPALTPGYVAHVTLEIWSSPAISEGHHADFSRLACSCCCEESTVVSMQGMWPRFLMPVFPGIAMATCQTV